MENQELINQLDESMKNCEQKFNEINSQIQETQERFEQLKEQREQIRGEYTAYYTLRAKLQNTEPVQECECERCECEEAVNSQEEAAYVQETPVVEPDPVQVQETQPTEIKEEIKEETKLDNVISALSKGPKQQEDDIPEYLK